MNFYLAGPMRGYHLYNLHAFSLGAYRLRQMGHLVYSPFEIDLAFNNYQPHEELEVQDFDLKAAMCRDLEYIAGTHCEAIALLPYWSESKGAGVEVIVGKTYERQLFEFDDAIEDINLICVVSWDLSLVIGQQALDKLLPGCDPSTS